MGAMLEGCICHAWVHYHYYCFPFRAACNVSLTIPPFKCSRWKMCSIILNQWNPLFTQSLTEWSLSDTIATVCAAEVPHVSVQSADHCILTFPYSTLYCIYVCYATISLHKWGLPCKWHKCLYQWHLILFVHSTNKVLINNVVSFSDLIYNCSEWPVNNFLCVLTAPRSRLTMEISCSTSPRISSTRKCWTCCWPW